jgi:hypothetical protein
MTPKEKAQQIVNRFKDIGYVNKSQLQKLSLVVANEVTEQWEYVDTYLSDMKGDLNPNLKYWYEVINILNEYNFK